MIDCSTPEAMNIKSKNWGQILILKMRESEIISTQNQCISNQQKTGENKQIWVDFPRKNLNTFHRKKENFNYSL